MSNIGCRIYTEINRPEKELIERFRGLPVANIGDNMNRLYCVDGGIRPLNKAPLLGTAFTLHLPAGDNLLFLKALECAKPGDVIVISSGNMDRAFCGELMMMYAKLAGIAGFVIDGCIRDIEETSHMDFPVYARGVTPQGPYKFGPGEMNVPIAFGGQVVFPGDIVIGDSDGLIFIRPEDVPFVLGKIVEQNNKENKLKECYINGDAKFPFNKELMDKTLDERKFEIINNSWKF